MTFDSSKNAVRGSGYILVMLGVLYAALAVDEIFFGKANGIRWTHLALALVFLVSGTWMVIRRRDPFQWIDDWVGDRWGRRGMWFAKAGLVVVLVSLWLLSRSN